jgi:16S rRNA (guanine527-N7)-methyltransferase
VPSSGGHASVELALAALADRYGLPPEMGDQLQVLLTAVVTDPFAPTTITDPVRAVGDHLADSLVALELPEVRSAAAIADLGSGAGLPGLPLAIALPCARVVLVESSRRKCAFIQRAAIACQLGNAEVVNARVEDWPAGRGRSDLVTARALAPLDVVVEYAAPLLKLGGRLLAWRGRRDADAEMAAQRAAEAIGLEVGPVLKVTPYAGIVNRHLHLMSKVMDTPPQFPRRPGMAVKRPLGAQVRASDRSRR